MRFCRLLKTKQGFKCVSPFLFLSLSHSLPLYLALLFYYSLQFTVFIMHKFFPTEIVFGHSARSRRTLHCEHFMDLFLQTFTCPLPLSPPLPAPFELNARFAANFMCLFANANCGCELRSAECGLRCKYFSAGAETLRRDRLLASWRNCCKVNRKLAASVVCKRGQSCCNVCNVCNVPLLKPCCGKCQVHFAVRKSLSRSRSMSLSFLLSLHHTACLPLATCHTPQRHLFGWQFIKQIAFHWRGQKALATRSGSSSLAA